MTFALLTFALVLVPILGAYWFFVLRGEGQAQSILRGRLKAADRIREQARAAVVQEGKKLSHIPALDRVLAQREGLTAPIRNLVIQAGSEMTPGLFLLSSASFAAAGYLVTVFLLPFFWLALAVGILTGLLPLFYLLRMRKNRVDKFEEQFPEAVDLIARALRAGHAFTTGLGMVSDEVPEPVSLEFRRLHEEQNFGMPLPDAMRRFAARVPLLDARFFVTAVLTQRESGGNLSEVLDNLSSVVRERFKVKRQVRVLTAHGRLTGWILVAMPPVMGAILYTMNPGAWQVLFTDPLGLRMMLGALVLQLIGVLVIRKLVNIEY
ncbi:MAG: type II secretion system F family protein [Vicinamibacterales bacterium]